MRKLAHSLAALTAIATSITLAAAPANAEPIADTFTVTASTSKGDVLGWDNFQRSDQPMSGSVAPSGRRWTTGGNGTQTITANRYKSLPLAQNASIAYQTYDVPPTLIEHRWTVMPGGTTTWGNAVIGACKVGFGSGSIQLSVTDSGDWKLFKVPSPIIDPYPTLGSGKIAPLKNDGTTINYASISHVLGTTEATVTLPDGTTHTFTDVDMDRYWGNKVGIQSREPTPSTNNHREWVDYAAHGLSLVGEQPVAPSNAAAARGDEQAAVTWTAPANNGSAITSYTITSSPGGFTKTVTGADTTSAVIAGLTNGTGYSFTVVATNAVGDSPASAASNTVTPAGVPDTVAGVSAAGGNGSATVSWTKPSGNGSPVTGYTITSTSGGFTKTVTGADTTSAVITGLTNGTGYSFTVVATNAVGDSPASAASNTVTPAGVPDTVAGVSAAGGNGSATVSWTKPSGNGSPVTGYTITSTSGGFTKTVTGADTTSAVITGLTNGTGYSFTVVATNAVGDSPASAASNTVTPAGVPDTVAGVSAAGGNGSATVSWTKPSGNGSPVTGYTITSTSGGFTKTVTGADTTSAVIAGLTNGTGYSFTVVATNAVGDSPASAAAAASNKVTPAPPAVVRHTSTLATSKARAGAHGWVLRTVSRYDGHAWANKPVILQVKYSGRWRDVKAVRTGSTGRANLTVTPVRGSRAKYYRAVLSGAGGASTKVSPAYLLRRR